MSGINCYMKEMKKRLGKDQYHAIASFVTDGIVPHKQYFTEGIRNIRQHKELLEHAELGNFVKCIITKGETHEKSFLNRMIPQLLEYIFKPNHGETFLEIQSQLKQCKIDPMIQGKIIYGFGFFRKFDEMEDLVNQIKELNDDLLISVFKVLFRESQYELVERLLEYLVAKNISSAGVYNVVLKMCLDNEALFKKVHSIMKKAKLIDSFTVNLIVEYLLSVNRPEKAKEEILKAKYLPDPKDIMNTCYSKIIKYHGQHKNLRSIIEIYNVMLQENVEIDSFLLNDILSSVIQCGDVKKAIFLFESNLECSSPISASIIFKAFTDVSFIQDYLHFIGLPLNYSNWLNSTYGTAIIASSLVAHEPSFKRFVELGKLKFGKDVTIRSSIMMAQYNFGKYEDVLKIDEKLYRDRKQQLKKNPEKGKEPLRTKVGVSAVIQSLVKLQAHERAIKLFNSMIHKINESPVETTQLILESFNHQEDYLRFDTIVNFLFNEKKILSTRTMNLILENYRKRGLVQEFKFAWDYLKNTSKLDKDTCSIVLSFYADHSSLSELMDQVKTFEKNKISFSPCTFNSLISASIKEQNTDYVINLCKNIETIETLNAQCSSLLLAYQQDTNITFIPNLLEFICNSSMTNQVIKELCKAKKYLLVYLVLSNLNPIKEDCLKTATLHFEMDGQKNYLRMVDQLLWRSHMMKK